MLLFQYNPMWLLTIYTEVYVYVEVDMYLPLHKEVKTLQSEYQMCS